MFEIGQNEVILLMVLIKEQPGLYIWHILFSCTYDHINPVFDSAVDFIFKRLLFFVLYNCGNGFTLKPF